MIIRQETYKDHKEVYKLVAEAFATAEHADGHEQELVAALRKGNAFIPALSLVAETGGEIIGHIVFTKARVGNADVLVLAPLSVKPSYQKQGVGTALILEGHRIAKELGYAYSLCWEAKPIIRGWDMYPRRPLELWSLKAFPLKIS